MKRANTSRKTYIQLLEAADGITQSYMDKPLNRNDTLLAELIDAGLIHGRVSRDDAGHFIQCSQAEGITAEGRAFLEHLHEVERESRFLFRLAPLMSGVFGFVLGIIGPVLSDLLRMWFGLTP